MKSRAYGVRRKRKEVGNFCQKFRTLLSDLERTQIYTFQSFVSVSFCLAISTIISSFLTFHSLVPSFHPPTFQNYFLGTRLSLKIERTLRLQHAVLIFDDYFMKISKLHDYLIVFMHLYHSGMILPLSSQENKKLFFVCSLELFYFILKFSY